MLLLPFVLFVVAMTGTPGPGNLSMMAIGQAGGFKKAIPFLLGTTTGCLIINTSVGLGLGEIISSSTWLDIILKVLGTSYIVYLGVKVLRLQLAPPETHRFFTYWEGLWLHPLSPKTWAMSIVGFTQFADPNAALAPKIAVFVLCFFIGQVTFHSLWCLAGGIIMRWMRRAPVRMAIQLSVVFLMVGATVYALFV